MALLGYARVSTSHQKLTHQISELKNAGVWENRIFTDMMTGATDEREGLQRLLARAENDNVIIRTKMDRVGRKAADMIRIADGCYKKGIAIRFLENGLSTEGTMGKILAAVEEGFIERRIELDYADVEEIIRGWLYINAEFDLGEVEIENLRR
ncbi:recombinase family protein [Enterobacter asburiae]|uniref:recombinase family protein n=1 Tax=Enterobacter asburiae TaxID=61645 RepID=UPI001E4D204C|nr:recombinase family protein [Enterobacter asburiae]MCE2004230.1 recombinase family protein [Enterobacter asburiae]